MARLPVRYEKETVERLIKMLALNRAIVRISLSHGHGQGKEIQAEDRASARFDVRTDPFHEGYTYAICRVIMKLAVH